MSRFHIAFCAAAICVASAPAQRHSGKDLTEVGLEELMNIEVISVSKREQKLARTPAAVSILTQEDIRRSGATSIPDVLRLVPGIQVASIDTGRFAVTARGFNGQYSNKLLVMIDGRSVYTPLFSGVYWDMHDLLLADIDRIEVIRGPGASLWGSNAVNGVINILTKPAGQTQGGRLTAGSGNEQKGLLSFRYGGRLGSTAHYRFYTKYTQTEALGRNPSTLPTDDWLMGRTGFRVDWDVSPKTSLSVQGQVFKSNNHQAVDEISGQPPFVQRVYGDLLSSGGFGMARWQHQISGTSDVRFGFYYDRYKREESIVKETRDTFDFDFQHRFRLAGRHQVLWGLEQRYTSDRTVGTAAAELLPDHSGQNLTSAFVQDEIGLAGDRLSLTLGSKFEHNAFTGFEVQPTARLLWMLRENQSAWAAVSRAVRTPSRGEEDGVAAARVTRGVGGVAESVGPSSGGVCLGNLRASDPHRPALLRQADMDLLKGDRFRSLRRAVTGLALLALVGAPAGPARAQTAAVPVAEALDGREAVERAALERFDVILMDVQMPVMSGLEAARAIREREKQVGGHVSILAVTAHAMTGDRERCLEAGMDGYVSKPIDVGELREKIDSVTTVESRN